MAMLERFSASLSRSGEEGKQDVESRKDRGPAGVCVELTLPSSSGLPELHLGWIDAFRRQRYLVPAT